MCVSCFVVTGVKRNSGWSTRKQHWLRTSRFRGFAAGADAFWDSKIQQSAQMHRQFLILLARHNLLGEDACSSCTSWLLFISISWARGASGKEENKVHGSIYLERFMVCMWLFFMVCVWLFNSSFSCILQQWVRQYHGMSLDTCACCLSTGCALRCAMRESWDRHSAHWVGHCRQTLRLPAQPITVIHLCMHLYIHPWCML